MNNFSNFLSSLDRNGIKTELKKKINENYLADVKQNEIDSIGTKSILSSTAKLISNLSSDERFNWAVEVKNEANSLFKEGKYNEAMIKYVEALTASDFGTQHDKDNEEANQIASTGNIDSLIVPILRNLSSCSIKLEKWNQGLGFINQALYFRPLDRKSNFKKAVISYNLKDYSTSFKILKTLLKNSESLEGDYLSDNDAKKAKYYFNKSIEGMKFDKEINQKQKESIAKAFQPSKYDDSKYESSEVNDPDSSITIEKMEKSKYDPKNEMGNNEKSNNKRTIGPITNNRSKGSQNVTLGSLFQLFWLFLFIYLRRLYQFFYKKSNKRL